MRDRELLELAAKAAGIDIDWSDFLDHGSYIAYRVRQSNRCWNALADDGDALRLAATLRLQIKPGKYKGDGCTVETQRDGIAGCTAFYDDKAQQMRQAIVRAAAEIGRVMP
jgi:hypothetical protein